MNLTRIYLIATLLLAFGVISSGQEPMEPILIDETGEFNCDGYRGMIDLWMVEVRKNSGSMGYAIVQGPENDLFTRLLYRDWIYGHLEFRQGKNWDVQKFRIVEGNNSPQLKVQFWRTTGEMPEHLANQKKWDFSLSLVKPMKFDLGEDPGGLCASFNRKKVFAELIAANPNISGKVVFFEDSPLKFKTKQQEFLNSYGSGGQSRFRFFRSTNNGWPEYELWLVPRPK